MRFRATIVAGIVTAAAGVACTAAAACARRLADSVLRDYRSGCAGTKHSIPDRWPGMLRHASGGRRLCAEQNRCGGVAGQQLAAGVRGVPRESRGKPLHVLRDERSL